MTILMCRITAKWYRFTSAVSDRIPETCVAPNHCGTQWPIWMDRQHPTGNVYTRKHKMTVIL